MSEKAILLGFEVTSGKPYYVPRHHTAITGMSDLSGKTTASEAKFRRGGGKTLVFLTKRGEKTFLDAQRIPPYYKERFDWGYVRGLLEAAMKERLKFETPWIIRICKQAKIVKKQEPQTSGLNIVSRLLKEMLQKEKLREFDRNIYTLLDAYMDKVLPVLEEAKEQFTDKLELKPGLNVMDLTPWYTNEEVQMLVIRSCMEHILKEENDVDVSMPEAWKMLPQTRNTPVKLYFEKFIREGATNGNFLTIDAQDLGGVDKTPLRQVSIWIMGKMMEANEVQRLLKQTIGLELKAEDIQTLKLGHFVVADGITNTVTKIYVWPWGVPKDMAIAVAKGTLEPQAVKEFLLEKRKVALARMETPDLGEWMEKVDKQVAILQRDVHADSVKLEALKEKVDAMDLVFATINMGMENVREQIEILTKRAPIPVKLGDTELHATIRNVSVTTVTKDFKLTDETATGKIMFLAKEGFLNTWRSQGQVEKELTAKAWTVPRITIYKALKKLVSDGFLGERKTDRMQYKIAPNVRFQE